MQLTFNEYFIDLQTRCSYNEYQINFIIMVTKKPEKIEL